MRRVSTILCLTLSCLSSGCANLPAILRPAPPAEIKLVKIEVSPAMREKCLDRPTPPAENPRPSSGAVAVWLAEFMQIEDDCRSRYDRLREALADPGTGVTPAAGPAVPVR